jgi:hypothetical protein
VRPINKKTLITSLLLAAIAAGITGTVSAGDKSPVKKDAYELERAKFFYLAGDYLNASVLCKRLLKGDRAFPQRNRAVLLKWLSDLHLKYRDDAAPEFRNASFRRLPGLLELFETLYKEGDYETIISLSEGIEGAASRYFKSLGLYRLGRLDGAKELLEGIPRGYPLYPYARIMLAQLMVTRGDLDSSESYLLGLLGPIPVVHGELADIVNLRLGYLLFDKGEFSRAEENFLKVPPGSRSYRAALEGAAWSRIKRGLCNEALVPLGPPATADNPEGQEILIAAADCYYKQGMFNEARGILARVFYNLQVLEDGLRTISDGAPLTEGASGIEGEVEKKDPANKNFIDMEKLRAGVESGPDGKAALGYHKAFESIKLAYENREREIELLSKFPGGKTKSSEEALAAAKERIKIIRPLLEELAKRVLVETEAMPVFKQGKMSMSDIEENIVPRWEKFLGRTLTNIEKKTILMITLDGIEGIWYLNYTAYPPILSWMAADRTKKKPGGYGKGTLERIVKDLDMIKWGAPFAYEQALPALEERKLKKMDDKNMLLRERLTSSLGVLEDRVTAGKKRTGGGFDVSLGLKQSAVPRSARMMRYELDVLKKKALSVLEVVGHEETAEKK